MFQISRCKIDHSKREQTQVYCLRCPSNSHPTNPIAMEAMPSGAVQIENSNLVLLFDEDSRMLKQVRNLALLFRIDKSSLGVSRIGVATPWDDCPYT